LESAKSALNSLQNFVATAGKPKVGCAGFEQRFAAAINDDLNTPQALAVVWELLKSDYPASAKLKSLLKFDEVLGLGLKNIKPLKVPTAVKKLAASRLKARQNKDWRKADELRAEIEKLGFLVEDTKEGFEIKRK